MDQPGLLSGKKARHWSIEIEAVLALQKPSALSGVKSRKTKVKSRDWWLVTRYCKVPFCA